MSAERMAYVGYCPMCGALYAAHVIDGARTSDLEEFVIGLVSDRARIATVPCEVVRQTLALCDCKWPARVPA